MASLRSDISAACVVGFCRCRLLGLRGGSIAVRLAPHSSRYAPLIYRIQLEAANRDAVVLHHEYQNKKVLEEALSQCLHPLVTIRVDRGDRLLHQITKITSTKHR